MTINRNELIVVVAMASKNDRYRNPPMPLGYKSSQPEVKYKEGINIDNVCCRFLHLILQSDVLNDDSADLSDFIIQSSDDEDVLEPSGEIAVKKEHETDEEVSDKKNDFPAVAETKPVSNIPMDSSFSNKKKITEKVKDGGNMSIKRECSSNKIKLTAYSDESSSENDDHSSNHSQRKKYKRKNSSLSPSSENSKKEKNSNCSNDCSSKKNKLKEKRVYSESSSENDDRSSSHSHHKRYKKRYSPSSSPESWKKEKIVVKTEESLPDHLYGYYFCEDCQLTLNSASTYESHIQGKRHKKVLKSKNVLETVSKTIPFTEVANRYPRPPPGIHRIKVNERAKIQDFVEKEVRTPCPGLHSVTEIQGMGETTYYCSLCDSPCSLNSILPHLMGFKHLLNCLKHFQPALYDKMSYKPKYLIEDEVINILKAVEKKEGKGKMVVEKDAYGKGISHSRDANPGNANLPTTSYGHHPVADPFDESAIRDMSKPGYYCKICEAPMNNSSMWESHIRGRRHLNNIKKMPGAQPSKTKAIPLRGVSSVLVDRLKYEVSPVVGLEFVQETQNPEIHSEMYQCYLCSACHTSLDIIKHLTSHKHRTKYLQQIKHPDMELLKGLSLQDSSAISLVEEICARVEEERGRRCPSVFVTKSAVKI